MRGLIAICVGFLLALGAGAAWATTSQGDGSCMGTDACDGQTGDIGDESCNAFTACQAQSGGIGDESCNDAGACMSQLGDIGNKSCNGNNACQTQSGGISDKSCNGPASCQVQTGEIGDESCNELNACTLQTGEIGDGLCNFPQGCKGSSRDRSPCLGGGMAVSGIPGCWFLSDKGESCSDACQERGYAYDEATSTVTGSEAPNIDACRGVLGEGLDSGDAVCSEGAGCVLDDAGGGFVVRCTNHPTTADAVETGLPRVCACRDTAPAPAASPYGIAVLLVALAGFGVWRVRKRAA